MGVKGYGDVVNPVRRTYFVSEYGKGNFVYGNSDKGGNKQKERGDRCLFETGWLVDVEA